MSYLLKQLSDAVSCAMHVEETVKLGIDVQPKAVPVPISIHGLNTYQRPSQRRPLILKTGRSTPKSGSALDGPSGYQGPPHEKTRTAPTWRPGGRKAR
jgi:hypothetical protein